MYNDDKPLAHGEAIGPYTVTRVLGSGAFGVVHEAVKRPLGKRVAVKVLRRMHAADPDLTARFVREAHAAASLRHPHIVEVDDVGAADGIPFFAMEFLEGQNLADRIDHGGRLSTELTLEVMLPICSAVAAVHDRGIIHRDLKPDNILLWQPIPGQTHPKLLDFGIAKMQPQLLEGSLTATGTRFGTPRYMPPEQWSSSKHTTVQSDQWALAVIVYECLSATTPYDAEEMTTLVLKMATEPPRPLRSLVPEAPEALERVLAQALSRDPLARYPSVRDFAQALLPFASAGTRSRWAAEFDPFPHNGRGDTMRQGSNEALPRAAPSSHTLQHAATEILRPRAATQPPRVRALGVVAAAAVLSAAVVGGVALLFRAPTPVVSPTVVAVPTPLRAAAVAPAAAAPSPPPSVAAEPPRALADPAPAREPEADAESAETPVRRHGRRHRRHARGAQVPSAPGSGEMPNL